MIPAVLLLMIAPSQASETVSLSTITGAMLAQECSRDRGMVLDVCVSYILGVADTLQLEGKTCRPNSDAATMQTVAIARRYIASHPEEWGRHPSTIVRAALTKMFPCTKQRR